MSSKSRFTEADFQQMERLYAEGHSTKQVARMFNTDGGTVYYHLKQRGILLRCPSASKRCYSVRHDAFIQVDDEPTAYWLGFLFADGAITRTHSKYVRLWLNEKDRFHLEEFRAFLASDYPIKSSVQRNAVGINITSACMFDDLKHWGCTERKSLTLRFPTLPVDLAPHFIRGYFDGDGSAYWGGGAPNLSLIGTEEFLRSAQQIILAATNADGRLFPHKRSHSFYLIYRGQFKVPVVRDWLYHNASIWLARKRDKLEGFPAGKRKGYPTAQRYVSTAGSVASSTIQAYIQNQRTRE